ncbi:MAG TPA: DUF5996 family protein [Streptosporangiaceae bacterium]
MTSNWPGCSYEDWRATCDTLHAHTQVLGKLAVRLAPPFTGLDTLPALGVVLISLGWLLEDILVVIAGLIVGAGGVILEIVLGSAAVGGVKKLF